MENPSQDEKHSGRDARGEGPCANNTNVSGPEPTRRGVNTANFSGCDLEPTSAASSTPDGGINAVCSTPRGVNAASLSDSRSGPGPSRFRASDDAYAQWTAEGKPNCMTCGKRHPPPCHAPLRRKRQAEEPAESSTTRASGRRRRAVANDQRAPTRTSPAPTQAASTPVHVAPILKWDRIIATSESCAQHRVEFMQQLQAASTVQERIDAFYSMFEVETQAPTPAQPVAQVDQSPGGANSTNPPPRDQAGGRQRRPNRRARHRHGAHGANAPGPPPQGESQEDIE